MNSPLVSIIVPVYNRESIVGKTLDSILAQSYSNIECIFVDDGSNDDTIKIIKSKQKKDTRIKLYSRPKKRVKGANACRNYGFEISKGRYVNWFDSDDVMHQDYVKKHLLSLEDNSFDYSICKSKWKTLDNNIVDGFRSSNLKSSDALNDYIQFKIFWPINAVFYRKEFLISSQLKFDENLQKSQEYDFHIRLLQFSKHYNILDEYLITVVASKNSISYSCINDLAKTRSSLQVKSQVLKNANKMKLEISTKHFLFHEMHAIFQKKLMQKKIRISCFAARKYLAAHFYDNSIWRNYFFKHFVYIIIVFTTYSLFGIGYRFFRKTNQFNYSYKTEHNE